VDFLKNMKAKLEELEREAQLAMQQQQQGQGLSQHKKNAPPEEDSYPRGGGRQGKGQQRRSRRPIDSEECPVDEVEVRSGVGVLASGGSIFDNLQGRLDEAFLLQEVLGQPRCVRGWDDD
jgi:hypothetical protein